MITIEWTLPDGTVTSSIASTYDERGNLSTRMEQHPGDAAHDQLDILTYEYDGQGNWTRRTLIRAVNPVDEAGQPSEDPVQITEREITYEPSSHFSVP